MPVTFSGYPAPITTAQLGPNGGTGPSQDEVNKWQAIGSPMGPGGFPAYNQIYNIYGNTGAAGLRNAQIGNTGGNTGGSMATTGLSLMPGTTGAPTIPGLPTSGAGSGGTTFGLSGGSNPTGTYSGAGATPLISGGGLTGSTAEQNLAAGPTLESLTGLVDRLNLQGQQAANAGRIPGGAGLENQSSQNIGNLLNGQIPPDVIRQLTQQAAERGIGMGSPGSDNSNSGLLRSLGLTSLGLQQQGQQDLSAADDRNPIAKVFDPSSQFLSPYQSGELSNQQNQLALEWYKALHPTAGGGGGGRQPSGGGDTSALPSWFPTIGGTPSSPQYPPPSGGGITQDPTYPGTSIPGLPNLGGILGQPDPGYGLSPDPFGQGTSFDASDPNSWDFTGGGYDPFQQMGGG